MTRARITDPVPAGIRAEMDRLAGRWSRLPYRQAVAAAPELTAVAARFAAREQQLRASGGDAERGGAATPVGASAPSTPAEAMDRLVAVLFDLFALVTSPVTSPEGPTDEHADGSAEELRCCTTNDENDLENLAGEVEASLVRLRQGLPTGIATPSTRALPG